MGQKNEADAEIDTSSEMIAEAEAEIEEARSKEREEYVERKLANHRRSREIAELTTPSADDDWAMAVLEREKRGIMPFEFENDSEEDDA